MNCVNWSDCMTPELSVAIVTLLLATVGMITAIVIWLPKYVTRVAEQKLKEKELDLANEQKMNETEVNAKNAETEIKKRQELALIETQERFLMVFSEMQSRHAKLDERNAENTEKVIEANNNLAASFERLNASSLHSQTWQENRTNDFLDTANVINERMGGLERLGKAVIDSIDRIEVGLIEARSKLNTVIDKHSYYAQETTLVAIQAQLASMALMVESLVPKPAPPAQDITEDLSEAIDKLNEIPMPTETIEDKKDIA